MSQAAEWPIDPKEFDGQPITEPELAEQQMVLNAQLRFTAGLIESALTDHPHFTDDCGEYLRGALDLSTQMMIQREEGLSELHLVFDQLKQVHPSEQDAEDGYTYFDEYPGDSVAPELREYMQKIGWKEHE